MVTVIAVGGGFAAGVSAELGAAAVSRLATLQQAARGLRAPQELGQIREDLADIVRRWRRLMVAHTPTAGADRCPSCRDWWGRRRWPCAVWTTGRGWLLGLDGATGLTSRTAPDAGASTTTSAGSAIRGRHARPDDDGGHTTSGEAHLAAVPVVTPAGVRVPACADPGRSRRP